MTFVSICLLVGGALARDMHLLRKLLGDEGAAVSQSATEPTHTKAMPTPAERIGNQRRDSRKCGVVDTHPEQARAPKEIVEREEILARRQAQKEELTLPGLSYDDYRRSDRGRSEQLEKIEAEIQALEETLAATHNPSKSTQDRLCSLKARRQELTMPGLSYDDYRRNDRGRSKQLEKNEARIKALEKMLAAAREKCTTGVADRNSTHAIPTPTCPRMPTRTGATEQVLSHAKSNQTTAKQTRSTQFPLVQDKGVFSSSSKTSHYTDIELGFSAKMDDAQYKKCLLDELKGTYTLSGGPSTGTGYTYTNQEHGDDRFGAFIQIDEDESDDYTWNWGIYTSEGVKHFHASNYSDRCPPKSGWYAVDYDEEDTNNDLLTEFQADQNNTVARFLELKGNDVASPEESYSFEPESSSEQQGSGWFW